MIDIDELYDAVTAAYEALDDEGLRKELRNALAWAWADGYGSGYVNGSDDARDVTDPERVYTNPYREES